VSAANPFSRNPTAASPRWRWSSSRSTSSPNGSCWKRSESATKKSSSRLFQIRPLGQHRRGLEPLQRQQRRAGLVALLALVALFLTRHHFDSHTLPGQIAFGLIFGGIAGNLTDRLLPSRHAVVDFIYFYLQQRGGGEIGFPAFNVADTAICTGVGLIFLITWKNEHAPKVRGELIRHVLAHGKFHRREIAARRAARHLSAEKFPAASRGALQRLIEEGHIRVNGKTSSPRIIRARAKKIEVHWPEARPAEAQPEKIPLDILFEDKSLLVLNKPAGLVVHPAAGHEEHTLVNALLHHCAGLVERHRRRGAAGHRPPARQGNQRLPRRRQK
jgi:hypothetical protein